MNAAIIAWALVMGGAVISGADEPDSMTGGSVGQHPSVDLGTFAPQPSTGVPIPGADEPDAMTGGSVGQRPLVDFDLLAPQPSSSFGAGTGFSVPRPSLTGPAPSGASRAVGSVGGLVPFAPTDPGAASEAYPWGAPTSGSAQSGTEGAGAPGSGPSPTSLAPRLSGSSGYLIPRASRPAYQPPSSYDSFSTQQARLAPSNRTLPSSAAPTSAPKPYSDYSRPSAVSPYLELDRITDSSGGINNYYQYVRPRLEQANANRQMGSDIRGLQHSVRNLGRQTTSVRGLTIPQYYMNYETYYPGFQR